MGLKTVFSAGQAAEGMRRLAQAGVKTNDILVAIEEVLKLAAAGELNLADAARIAATTTVGMNRSFEDLGQIVDVLAHVANNSATDIYQLGEALKFATSTADIVGADIDEIGIALQILANRMFIGSRAGAGLNRTFAVIGGSVAEGTQGLKGYNFQLQKIRAEASGLTGVLAEFREAQIGGDEATTVFGTRAGPVSRALINYGVENFDKTLQGFKTLRTLMSQITVESTILGDELGETRKTFENAGIAGDTAAKKLDNFYGSTVLLKSAFQGLQIAVFKQVLPALRTMIDKLTTVTRESAKLVEGSDKIGVFLRGAVKIVSSLINWSVKGIKAIDFVVTAVRVSWKTLEIATLASLSFLSGKLAAFAKQMEGLFRVPDAAPFSDALNAFADLVGNAAVNLETLSKEGQAKVIEMTKGMGETLENFAKRKEWLELLTSSLDAIDEAAAGLNFGGLLARPLGDIRAIGESIANAIDAEGAERRVKKLNETINALNEYLLSTGVVSESALKKIIKQYEDWASVAPDAGTSVGQIFAAALPRLRELNDAIKESGELIRDLPKAVAANDTKSLLVLELREMIKEGEAFLATKAGMVLDLEIDPSEDPVRFGEEWRKRFKSALERGKIEPVFSVKEVLTEIIALEHAYDRMREAADNADASIVNAEIGRLEKERDALLKATEKQVIDKSASILFDPKLRGDPAALFEPFEDLRLHEPISELVKLTDLELGPFDVDWEARQRAKIDAIESDYAATIDALRELAADPIITKVQFDERREKVGRDALTLLLKLDPAQADRQIQKWLEEGKFDLIPKISLPAARVQREYGFKIREDIEKELRDIQAGIEVTPEFPRESVDQWARGFETSWEQVISSIERDWSRMEDQGFVNLQKSYIPCSRAKRSR
jgi:hypothetical protein